MGDSGCGVQDEVRNCMSASTPNGSARDGSCCCSCQLLWSTCDVRQCNWSHGGSPR
jgi:hypothetical protein